MNFGQNKRSWDGLGLEFQVGDHDDHEVVMIIVIIWSSFIILASFWSPCGGIFEAFWGHVDLQNHLGSSLRAWFVSEADLTSSTHPILEDFGKLLGRFLQIFL